jgi:3-oxoacyl-[acyl-carrier-protein] synthase-3
MAGLRMRAWALSLPPQVVTNAELAARLDTSEQWIFERTGIRQRHIGGTTRGLGAEALAKAMAAGGLGPDDVDVLVLSTTTPDRQIPQTAIDVQRMVGLSGAAVDINAACSGFVYGLVMAAGLLALGSRRVALLAAETLSAITDWEDRSFAVLAGDGAAAFVLEDGPGELVAWDLGADGSGSELLTCERGGLLRMDGAEVFRRAVRATADSVARTLARAGESASAVGLFVPHQANQRIIEAVAARTGIPMERTALVIDRTGNTSSASIGVALAGAADCGVVEDGDLVLLAGFGAGMTWGSALIRWAT